ncbi:MAG: hypothetical protein ACPGWR_13575, partial [Ardenticatenaceae bacterium]
MILLKIINLHVKSHAQIISSYFVSLQILSKKPTAILTFYSFCLKNRLKQKVSFVSDWGIFGILRARSVAPQAACAKACPHNNLNRNTFLRTSQHSHTYPAPQDNKKSRPRKRGAAFFFCHS